MGPTHGKHKTDRSVPELRPVGPRPERLWLLALSTALIGGMLGWVLGNQAEQAIHWTVQVRPHARGEKPEPDATGFSVPLVSREEAERRNTTLVMGIFGGVLGLSVGAGGGLARNTSLATLQAGLTGLMLGSITGSSVPWMFVPEFYRQLSRAPNPMLPVLMHAITYASIGGAAGLAFGYGLLERRGAARGLLAGVMGAVLGSMIFAVLHTMLFPMEWDFSPIPGKTVSRLLAHVCVAVLSVTCATLALREDTRQMMTAGTSIPAASNRESPGIKAR